LPLSLRSSRPSRYAGGISPKSILFGQRHPSAGRLEHHSGSRNRQQAPIVNLPGNSLGVSQTELAATALIEATVPLYDGGARAALREQARDTVDRAGTTLSQIRNEAVRQIVTARNTLTTNISAYSAATALASAAQTTFNAALAAYRNGVGSISDATTAERQLLAAKNAATDAYSAALSAAATLALATGVLGSAPNKR
jgi:outer membrane protein